VTEETDKETAMFSRRSDTTWKRKSIRLHINLGVLRETYIQQLSSMLSW